MIMNKKELWLRIANYQFDHLVPNNLWDTISALFGSKNPSELAFADKLTRKLSWDKKYAMKAIWEYKKFVYLGVISDFSVTPSKVIDQVWHEHLLFSAAYRKFCSEIIEYSFDHNPELVPVDAQIETYQSQYYHTIELYKKEFGAAPPAEIWDNTKFKGKKEKLDKPKKNDNNGGNSNGYDDSPALVSMFPAAESGEVEFGEGGVFDGGGAGGNWDGTAAESTEVDAGDSSNSSDSGTSCSSSCGSGCGGD